MRKILSLFLVTAILVTVFSTFSFSVSADFPEVEDMFGYENLCLTYNFNIKAENNGRHTAADLAPYVAYYDTNGNIKDFFFDSFLFLPINGYAPSGGTLHYEATKPNKASDWIAYVDDTFYKDSNVNALNTAMGEAKKALNDSERKAGVVLTVMYPGWGDSNFGTLDGRKLDFNKLDDRKFAIKWMVEEQIKRFEAANYEHLELIGFYWLEEWIISYGGREDNLSLYRYVAECLEPYGLKYIWIPYYQSTGYTKWESYGFDIACMQPNMFWEDNRIPERVVDCANECKSLGMGMEIEVDYRAISTDEYYQRYLDYLEGGMVSGAMNTIKMYYQDGKPAVYYHAFNSTSRRARSIYDLTYKYAKGTLTQADIDEYRPYDFQFPEGVEIVSHGKPYVSSGAYVGEGTSDYQKIDGKELTDGIIGETEVGTEWHAFHVSLLDSEKRMSVTVDLGKEYRNLTHFGAHFNHVQDHGIGDPSDVRISVSTDGKNFKEIAKPEYKTSGISGFVEYVCNAVVGRYVKFSFLKSDTNFVFCSEVYAGASGEDAPEVEPEPDPDPEPDPEPKGKNVALNKSYTISGSGKPYGQYTAKLTDGEAHQSISYDDKWFAFYYNSSAPESQINAPAQVGYAVIDLGKAYDLTEVKANLIDLQGDSGITAPKAVNVYLSADGISWSTPVALDISANAAKGMAYIASAEITGNARFVKFEFELGDIFAFVNELEVYSEGPFSDNALGDVNNDGAIDQFDYILVKRHYFETRYLTEEELLRADVNSDGAIDQFDYILIKRIYFGTYVVD